MNLYFMINPAAKNGRSVSIWKQLQPLLDREGIAYQAYWTSRKGEGKEIARRIGEESVEPTVIAAVGGDGTVHEVVNGAGSFPHVAIGCIPAGTGNDFVRGFRLARTSKQALQRLLSDVRLGRVLSFDLGRFASSAVPDGVFANSIGCGFDAHIARMANRSKWKGRLNRFGLGSFIYVFYLVRELFRYQPVDLDICVDGQNYSFLKAWLATVSNHPYYGGGMRIAPSVRADDGLLHVTVVGPMPRWKILALFLTVFWGGHVRMKEVCVFTGRNVRIRPAAPVPIHADGEDAGEGEVFAWIEPGRLRVIGVKTR
ncbi:diacylglycerol kinase [Geobacillus subterraneus]|uniref:Diacylglycerol kinase n=2 Tax=Geobacillus TaxID=129337 RepID=A0ABM6AD59_9BACL|nr:MULTISPECIES: diacylglycerol kinase family protein [Geobacillus]AMX84294.1 diacylglycerol kinase [Geobacillus subterraneus]KZS27115.1 diacylglycerol kinase [Geobacillus subterraneus]OXB88497.1 diacylglycerol kinase [Geobacillus uzenensis]WPZ19255.1 diacylglycerol kinase family protein [Geobacillus subterraneus]